MNILKKTLKATGLEQSALCQCGFHKMVWYSKADYEMYYTEGRKFGPLVECLSCFKMLHIEDVDIEDVEEVWLTDYLRKEHDLAEMAQPHNRLKRLIWRLSKSLLFGGWFFGMMYRLTYIALRAINVEIPNMDN